MPLLLFYAIKQLENLSGVEKVLGVKYLLDTAHKLDCNGIERAVQVFLLCKADTVLARNLA